MDPTCINIAQSLDTAGIYRVLQDDFRTTSYSWTMESQLQSIWNPYNERTTISYDALDRGFHRVLANSMTVSHTWDSAGRETVLANYGASGIGLAIFTNSYSANDNRVGVLEMDSTLCTYQYDASSQITYEARSGAYAYARSYVWDRLGNRLQQWDSGSLTAGQFNAANELTLLTLPAGQPTTWSYDPNGNLTVESAGGSLTTNIWSPEDKMLSTSSSSGVESYLYGQDGLRRQKTNTSGTANYTIDDPNVLLETTGAGALQARYTQNPDGYGGLVSQNQSGTSSFHGFDVQASNRILVSVLGAVTDAYSFKAFGEELEAGSGTINPHRYGGEVQYYRDATNIMQIGQRKLYAAIGRWVSRDAAGAADDDYAPYGYVWNCPVMLVDPTGRYPQVDPGCYSAVPNYKAINASIKCFCSALANQKSKKRQKIAACLSSAFGGNSLLASLSCFQSWCESGNNVKCSGTTERGFCRPDPDQPYICNTQCKCNDPACPCGCTIVAPPCADNTCLDYPGDLGKFDMYLCTWWSDGSSKKQCPKGAKTTCTDKTAKLTWLFELGHFCVPGMCTNAPSAESALQKFIECVARVC